MRWAKGAETIERLLDEHRLLPELGFF